MTYTITYRDRNGAKREEAVEAADRAACVAACRARGISPLAIREGGRAGRGPGGGRAGAPRSNPQSHNSIFSHFHISTILVVLSLLAILGGAWWWFAGRGAPALPDDTPSVKPKAMPKEVKPAKAKPAPVAAVGTKAPKEEVRRRHEPKYDKSGQRVFKNPNSPVARSWRSRHGQPPLVDFREEVDPNAPPPRYANSLQLNLSEYVVPGQATSGVDPITDKEAREFVNQKIEYRFDDSEAVLEEKKAVEELQEQLREWMDKGGHAMKFMQMLEERQERESEAMTEIQRNVLELCKEGDAETAQAALDKYNAYLESQGMPKMKMTHRMKRALEKAGGGKADGGKAGGEAQIDGK